MSSPILRSATRYLLPLLILFSLFVLGRGHDEPGGGFVGGLTLASAYSLYAIAHGVSAARRSLPGSSGALLGLGLLVAVGSGLAGLFAGSGFLSGVWIRAPVWLGGAIGTPILFDVGVYLAVTGAVLLLIFSLMED